MPSREGRVLGCWVLFQPIQQNRPDLIARYKDILTPPGGRVTLLRASDPIAEEAAELRVRHSLQTVDAIHLATALSRRADAFLINDRDFPNVPNIEILRVDEQ